MFTITFEGGENKFQIQVGDLDLTHDAHFWQMVRDEFVNYTTGVHPRTTEMVEAMALAKEHLPAGEFEKLQEQISAMQISRI